MDAMADQDDWADQGSCIGEDASLFDTIRYNKQTHMTEEVSVAQDICADCPVMVQCLEHALRFEATDGVWGSMVYEERLVWGAQNRPELMSARAWADLATYLGRQQESALAA
jgi:WhiB family redox-sensing transcriptional regulator